MPDETHADAFPLFNLGGNLRPLPPAETPPPGQMVSRLEPLRCLMHPSTIRLHSHRCRVLLGLVVLTLFQAAPAAPTRGDEPTLPAKPSPTAQTPADNTAEALFRNHVAALFIRRCLACHGGDKVEGGYSLRTVGQLLTAGDSQLQPVVLGAPARSELLRRLTTTDESERMPAESAPLTEAEIAAVRDWLAASASWNVPAASLTLAELAAAGSPRGLAPAHYPRPLPVASLAISQDDQRIYVNGYGEVLAWELGQESQPTESQPTESQPTESQPTESQPTESQPTESQPTESQPTESQTAVLHARIPVRGARIGAIRLTRNQEQLVVVSGEPGERGVVELISVAEPTVSRTVVTLSDLTMSLAVSPDDQRLAVGGADGSLTLARLPSGEVEARWTPHADAILDLDWSPDGSRLVSTSRDRTAKVYDMEKRELIANYDRHERAVGGAAYAKRGPLSLDETGRLRLWTGSDNDRTQAETGGLPRFLQHLTQRDEMVYVPAAGSIRRYQIVKKTVDDGQDDQGQPKTKTVIVLDERPRLESGAGAWILAVDHSANSIVAGTETGEILVWPLPPEAEESPRSPLRFQGTQPSPQR
jgi:WD40 repeat protein/mono/diheme cytochrome c family protein